jgi:hypothetical protein
MTIGGIEKLSRRLGGNPRGIERFIRTPEYIASILAELGSPSSFDELEPPVDEARVKSAFLNAPLIRRPATPGDLLLPLFWYRGELWKKSPKNEGGCREGKKNAIV